MLLVFVRRADYMTLGLMGALPVLLQKQSVEPLTEPREFIPHLLENCSG